MLNVGDKAPLFTLSDKDGKEISLSDFLGKKVVVYFYPKDNTPGCTKQACAFASAYDEFKAKNIEVIGISRDSVASHVKFAEKFSLPFILLSDPERYTTTGACIFNIIKRILGTKSLMRISIITPHS